MEKYEGKNFTVYCGDALELMPALSPPVDAIICDLPYGTTGVACLRTGRKFVGIEKDEKYFATALERLQREEDKVESGLFAQIENVKASETQQPLFSESVTYAYHTDGYAKTQVEVVTAD